LVVKWCYQVNIPLMQIKHLLYFMLKCFWGIVYQLPLLYARLVQMQMEQSDWFSEWLKSWHQTDVFFCCYNKHLIDQGVCSVQIGGILVLYFFSRLCGPRLHPYKHKKWTLPISILSGPHTLSITSRYLATNTALTNDTWYPNKFKNLAPIIYEKITRQKRKLVGINQPQFTHKMMPILPIGSMKLVSTS
jgi:hypothetical protein